jgi:hypothetical protein
LSQRNEESAEQSNGKLFHCGKSRLAMKESFSLILLDTLLH